MNEQDFLNYWNKIVDEKSIWDFLCIQDYKLYFQKDTHKVFLTSFKKKDMPVQTQKLSLKSHIINYLSTTASLMSRCTGSEELTLYCLISTPQNSLIGSNLDLKILKKTAPPITWRRVAVEATIRYLLKKYLSNEKKENFLFLDIGSGCGLDGLEINRIISSISNISNEFEFAKNNKIINIDINKKWTDNNTTLHNLIFPKLNNTTILNMDIFEYLKNKSYIQDIKGFDNLIVSCNGLVDFWEEDKIKKLYKGIYNISQHFDKKVNIILPFPIKNDEHSKIAEKIGFNYNAKNKEYMENLIKSIFSNYNCSVEEKYFQIVMTLEN